MLNLTTKSQEAIQKAHEIASQNNNQVINVSHLLLALLEQEESLVLEILKKLGVEIANCKLQI